MADKASGVDAGVLFARLQDLLGFKSGQLRPSSHLKQMSRPPMQAIEPSGVAAQKLSHHPCDVGVFPVLGSRWNVVVSQRNFCRARAQEIIRLRTALTLVEFCWSGFFLSYSP